MLLHNHDIIMYNIIDKNILYSLQSGILDDDHFCWSRLLSLLPIILLQLVLQSKALLLLFSSVQLHIG